MWRKSMLIFLVIVLLSLFLYAPSQKNIIDSAKTGNSAYIQAKYLLKKAGESYDSANYAGSVLLYDSAISIYNQLLIAGSASLHHAFKFESADCLTGKGLALAKLYKYQGSIECYLQGIASIEDIAGPEKNYRMATLYADIASNYYDLEQFESSLRYDKLGLHYIDAVKNPEIYIISNLFVADDYSSLKQYDSSSEYLEKVRPLVSKLNTPTLDLRFYYILGGIYRKKGEWSNALPNFQRSLEAAKKAHDDFQVINSEEGLAASNLHTGNTDKARELALHVLHESMRINIPLGKVQALQLLTEIEEKAGNISQAYQYQTQFLRISDSVNKERVQHQMNETEVKYQTEKKKLEIVQLQKDKLAQALSLKQKSTLNSFLIGILAGLLIFGFLVYRNLRNRQQLAIQQQELQRQRIRELEKDKQLVAVDFMLKGQEEERGRLAKDLHDGLGGLLSGVKFSLSNMKDNLIITPDSMAVFERSLDMIDTSIKELRRVAHNLMPEMLTRFGLDEALKEYCSTINSTNLLTVKYVSIGMENRFDKSVEIIIYRVIQELINNILKHALAKEAIVQLIREEGRLGIIVEDDGKGFDTSLLENSKGAGLMSIRSRVEYLKGQLDIHSEKGKGTLINIEFNI